MSDFIIQLEKLFAAIGDAEYRYLLLEPLIFYGLIIGVVLLVIGFFTKASKMQIAALVVIGVSALAHVPYKTARLSAEPRMEKIYKISAPARYKGFKDNTAAWVENSWKFKLLILAAGATVMIGVNRNRIGFGLAIATAFLGLLAAKDAMWLHYQDALAYHPNLKQHEAPIDQVETRPKPTVSPAPSARSSTAPPPATTTSFAPAALTQPYSAPTRQHNNFVDPSRIPPPEVPVLTPQRRAVQPLPRY